MGEVLSNDLVLEDYEVEHLRTSNSDATAYQARTTEPCAELEFGPVGCQFAFRDRRSKVAVTTGSQDVKISFDY